MSGKNGPTFQGRQNMKRVIWYHLMDWCTSAKALYVHQLVFNQRKTLQVSSLQRFCSYLLSALQANRFCFPLSLTIAPGAWKEAWSLVGYCSGTVKPTMSPNFETLDVIDGGCPDGWDEAGEYDEGDFVAVVVSEGFEDTSGRTRRPSSQPVTPTLKPTSQFCFSPTSSPTTSTSSPSKGPSVSPSSSPTSSPTTTSPSKSPTQNVSPIL